ncbi:MAG: alpha/beta hydrolase [Frankiaceae bacterium]
MTAMSRDPRPDGVRAGRLSFRRPRQAGSGAASPERGLRAVDLGDGGPPALVRVPAGPAGPIGLRLVLLLHGAGGSARRALDLMLPVADAGDLLLAAPQAVGPTWDALVGGYGPDVARIDRLLGQVTAEHAVTSLAIGGFSDGASYALSLGIANGDVFDAVVALSPGYAAPLARNGRPRFFVSHGTADGVLPIERCSRRLVPALRDAGYDVRYVEFEGGHVVPGEVVELAATWLAGG